MDVVLRHYALLFCGTWQLLVVLADAAVLLGQGAPRYLLLHPLDIGCVCCMLQEEIPWPALEYVIGQINYGGRVTDDLDRRCLMSILRQYITPRVLNDAYRITPK